MGKVILQTLQASDSQKTYSDKANYNFHLLADYINGVKTIKGDKGNVGMPGATGRQGIQGERGNSLFVYEGEFPYSTSEDKYKDLKNSYITWCEENGITDGDLVLFKKNQSIYKSGVNNEEKVPDKDKDLVVDLSKIINDFVTERDKGTTFWDRIDQDKDIITLKQYLDKTYKSDGNDAKIVLAPDMIRNNDVKGYVVNKLAEAPLNIFSSTIGGNGVNDIYNHQSGISLNSIYLLNGIYNVEDKDREFRITQRSVRKDKSNVNEIDYVEGLFVVAPQTSSSKRDGMTSGFRFISKSAKDSDTNSNTKKNNIVTIGDGKFTDGMLMNGYGGDNVENAITFARGQAEPTTDKQYGGYFSIGTEYDNNTVKGFIRTESTIEAKKGELVIGGYDTFLTFSYDGSDNKIFTKNQNIKIYSVDGSIERGLYINNDKSILLTNQNESSCNIKIDKQITQSVKNGDNITTTEVFYNGIKNNVSASNASITNVVNSKSMTVVRSDEIKSYVSHDVNYNFTIYQWAKRVNAKYDLIINNTLNSVADGQSATYAIRTSFIPLHLTQGINPLNTYDETADTNDDSRYTVFCKSDLYKRLEETYSWWLNTYHKKLTITNVYGGDVLNLVYPLYSDSDKAEGGTHTGEAFIQFKTYKTDKIETQWVGGIFLIPSGNEKVSKKDLNNVSKDVYKNYGIQIQSSTELVLKANNVTVNATKDFSINAKTINIGDASTTVNLAGNEICNFGGYCYVSSSSTYPYLWKEPISYTSYSLMESDTVLKLENTHMPIFYSFAGYMCLSFTQDMIGFILGKTVDGYRAGIKTFVFKYKSKTYNKDYNIKKDNENNFYYLSEDYNVDVPVRGEMSTHTHCCFFQYAYLKENKTIRIYPYHKDYKQYSFFNIEGKYKDFDLEGGYVYIVLHIMAETENDDSAQRAEVEINASDHFFHF